MKRIALLFVAATLGLSAPAGASAQGLLRDLMAQNERDNRRPPAQPGESFRPSQPPAREISMSQAIKIVERAAPPGHHLDGSKEDRGGRSVYRIQWATDKGERKDYVVDAVTGAILR